MATPRPPAPDTAPDPAWLGLINTLPRPPALDAALVNSPF
jgi:hypothetical protein